MSFDSINGALQCINNFNCDDLSGINFEIVTNAFRYLRNTCASGPLLQNEVDANIILTTDKILLSLARLESRTLESSTCLLVGLQFLANWLVNNPYNQKQVWNTCQNLIELCLKIENFKIQSCSAMILYNIFLGNPEISKELSHPYTDLIHLTLNEATSEFSLYTLEYLILKATYVERFYQQLSPDHRLVILEIILDQIKKKIEDEALLKVLKYLTDYFNKNCDCILNIASGKSSSYDPIEIIKILNILVAASSDNEHCFLEAVQKETSLFINSVFLLRSVHTISKESGNNFSMIQKISDLNEIEKEQEVQEHPAFGFKCSLIRLIGNMCWQNQVNQDQIREIEGIQVLLDCCNIDGRNPFIIQWTILAIRNICEKNIENQKVIAMMSKEGVIDSAALQEMGLNLSNDLIITPLTKN